MMTSCEPSPSGTPSMCISDVTLSTMMTEGENDNDTVTSLDQFPGEYTPAQWTNSKKLKTPTPSFPRTFDSNMSSVTCMKYAILQDSSQREIVTPLRDLMPLEQEVPYEPCQLPMSTEMGSANKENDSPTTVNVLSPATAFRMKKAVFETKAQAYKSPNRKQRARHVSLFDNSPTQQPTEQLSTSPNSAIVTETGDDSQIVTATATVEIVPTVLETKPLTPNSKQSDELIELNAEGEEGMSKEETQKEQEGVLIVKEAALSEATESVPEVVPEPESVPMSQPVEASVAVQAETEVTAFATPTPIAGPSVWKMATLVVAILTIVLFVSRAYISAGSTAVVVSAPVQVPTVISYSDLEVYDEPVEIVQEYQPDTMVESTSDAADIQSNEVVSAESDMQLSISATTEPSFLRDVEELGTALSVLLQHHLHNAMSSYETRHAPAVRAALTGLRVKMQPLTAAVVASVSEFHHTIDTSDMKHELLRVKQHLSAQVHKHTSGLKSALLDAKQQLYYKAPLLPVAEEALSRGLVSLKVGVKKNLLTMHRFIKENELLCEEYNF